MLSDAWIDFLAGWCSGGAAVLAIQPVDTVLTRLQAGAVVPNAAVTAQNATATASVRSLVSNVGVSSLWRGSSAMIGAVPLQNALLMGGYGLGKRWSSDQEDSTSDSNNQAEALTAIFVGGCVGGILQSFLMSPVELVKVHQQIHTEQSALAAGKYVVHTVVAGGSATSTAAVAGATSSGAASLSLWRGLSATLLRDGIPHGVWFVSYEMCKNYLESLSSSTSAMKGSDNINTVEKVSTNWSIPLASGAVAATVAWGVGYPFDLIKTRIQASRATVSSVPTVWGTAKTLVAEANGNALQGLYRGFGLKLVRSVPASMIGFTTYELVKETVEGW